MKISIITSSINRKNELLRFCCSINNQKNIELSNIQFIFVDQGENKDVISSLDSKIDITYLRHEKCSLSEARNYALPYVKNEVVAFGDDDCWYEDYCFMNIFKMFALGYDGVIGQSINEKGNNNVPTPKKQTKLDTYNHPGAISYTIFLKFDDSLIFDENIGVGSPYGLASGEETDYLIEFIRKHENVYFCPNVKVYHPEKLNSYFDNFYQKNYQYSRGTGFLLKKQHYPFFIKLKYFVRPLGGIFIHLFRGNIVYAKRSYYILIGRIIGYFTCIKK